MSGMFLDPKIGSTYGFCAAQAVSTMGYKETMGFIQLFGSNIGGNDPNAWVRRQYRLSVLWVSSRAGNRAVYGHGRGQHGRAKTQPSYYGPAPARGTEIVGLRVAVTAVKRHKKTVVSPHGPHRSLPCRVRAACESLTGSTARLRNRITVPYSVLHGYGCQP
ncbi:hypothetical protein B0H14DRAFT_2615968 [Mycena olivaceomarginata]|nr:hypothetical protein B0H14DRAFT_2615968 [Mycena olivaceomarginata]